MMTFSINTSSLMLDTCCLMRCKWHLWIPADDLANSTVGCGCGPGGGNGMEQRAELLAESGGSAELLPGEETRAQLQSRGGDAGCSFL